MDCNCRRVHNTKSIWLLTELLVGAAANSIVRLKFPNSPFVRRQINQAHNFSVTKLSVYLFTLINVLFVSCKCVCLCTKRGRKGTFSIGQEKSRHNEFEAKAFDQFCRHRQFNGDKIKNNNSMQSKTMTKTLLSLNSFQKKKNKNKKLAWFVFFCACSFNGSPLFCTELKAK